MLHSSPGLLQAVGCMALLAEGIIFLILPLTNLIGAAAHATACVLGACQSALTIGKLNRCLPCSRLVWQICNITSESKWISVSNLNFLTMRTEKSEFQPFKLQKFVEIPVQYHSLFVIDFAAILSRSNERVFSGSPSTIIYVFDAFCSLGQLCAATVAHLDHPNQR